MNLWDGDWLAGEGWGLGSGVGVGLAGVGCGLVLELVSVLCAVTQPEPDTDLKFIPDYLMIFDLQLQLRLQLSIRFEVNLIAYRVHLRDASPSPGYRCPHVPPNPQCPRYLRACIHVSLQGCS